MKRFQFPTSFISPFFKFLLNLHVVINGFTDPTDLRTFEHHEFHGSQGFRASVDEAIIPGPACRPCYGAVNFRLAMQGVGIKLLTKKYILNLLCLRFRQ